MSLISYSQNHEDIVLWRALRSVENGFYVDVGANDPTEDSVTKLFYDRGWSGINIEPSSEYHDRLVQERPRDINMQCAVGDRNGTITFYQTATRGWSTSDTSVGQHYVARGEASAHEVQQLTLDTLLQRHADGREIHFLKIDVEGAEAQVLRGLNLRKFRPWVLVVEALDPISQKPSYGDWEANVLAAGYAFVYFDGLNRFYVAAEHQSIASAFGYPPGVLDGFVSHTEAQLLGRLESAGTRIRELENSQHALQASLSAANAKASVAQSELEAVFASRSWRFTEPLRAALRLMRGQPARTAVGLKSTLVRGIWTLARRLRSAAYRHPKAKATLISVLTRLGLIHRIRGLQARLMRLPTANGSAGGSADSAWVKPSPASAPYLEQLQSTLGVSK